MAQDDLPERFDFRFYALPKNLAISVSDSKNDQSIYGAEVQIKYYDKATDHYVMKTDVTDHYGKAFFQIGKVTYATPSRAKFSSFKYL